MRRRNEARVRSSAGQVGSHGTRKLREAARSAPHSAASDIWGGRNTTPSPVIAGAASGRLTVRKNAMALSGRTMLRARNSAMSSTPPLHPTRPSPTPGSWGAERKWAELVVLRHNSPLAVILGSLAGRRADSPASPESITPAGYGGRAVSQRRTCGYGSARDLSVLCLLSSLISDL